MSDVEIVMVEDVQVRESVKCRKMAVVLAGKLIGFQTCRRMWWCGTGQ
jgi:hypothetical protein